MTPASKNVGDPCPYRKRTCDGLCNNCGLNASPSKIPTFAPATKKSTSGSYYENRILARQEAF